MERRHLLRAGLSLGATLAIGDWRGAAAQSAYPSRYIEVVVPFAAGGPTDIIGRFLSQGMAEVLGQSLVILNRPGAGGNLGTQHVARKPPDGYELLLAASTFAINPSIYANPQYDPIADFSPISLLGAGPLVLTVRNDLAAHTMTDLIVLAKSQPNGLTYASAGVGSANHLAGELFKQKTGINMVHVPYNGAAPASQALLAGTVDLLFNNMLSGVPMIRAGQVRGVAVSGPKRNPALPDLPAVAESIPGFDVQTWYVLLAPKGIDPNIQMKLNQAVEKVLSSPAAKTLLQDQGLEWAPITPKQVEEFMASEQQKYFEIVRASGAKVE